MSEPLVSFITDNDKSFERGIQRLAKTVSDFRKPFAAISNDWYKSNKIIFGLKSKGLYHEFGGFKSQDKVMYKGIERTKQYVAEDKKRCEVGFVFPLLKRHGDLEASMLSKTNAKAEYFLGRQTLIMGTNVSYAKYHQSDRDRRTLPQRKMVFISGGPNEPSRDSAVTGRIERWLNIMNTHITQVITGKV